jgi:hypothetical protein
MTWVGLKGYWVCESELSEPAAILLSDHVPFTDPKSKAAPRVAKPGELLFEFHRAADHKFLRCELRDYGKWGVEAQFFEGGEFFLGRRFEDVNIGDRIVKAREMAIAWAQRERMAIEASLENES